MTVYSTLPHLMTKEGERVKLNNGQLQSTKIIDFNVLSHDRQRAITETANQNS